jgi:hypothetical protein
MITALPADELERVGIAAFRPARHDPGRLAPQARRATVARLAGQRNSAHATLVNAQPRVSAIGPAARYHNGTRPVS